MRSLLDSLPRLWPVMSVLCLLTLATSGNAQVSSQKSPPSKEEQADLDVMNTKLNGIIIPALKCDNTPLPQVIELLRTAARDNDPAKEQANRGLNIFFIMKREATVPTTPVTLDLKAVSLRVAIETLAKQARLDMKVQRYAVALKAAG